MKKTLLYLVLCSLLLTNIVGALSYSNIETKTFGTTMDVTEAAQTYTNIDTLTFGTKLDVDDSAQSYTNLHTLSFGTTLTTYPSVNYTSPADDETNVDLYPQLGLSVSHDTFNTMVNVTWFTNYTDWVKTNNSFHVSEAVYQRADFVNLSNTKFWWGVNITDSSGNYENQTFCFTTRSYVWTAWSSSFTFDYSGNRPEAVNFTPNNNNITVARGDLQLSADISDGDGDTMNVSFYWADNDTLIGQNLTVGNGTYKQLIHVNYLQRVNWTVNLNDGIHWNNYSITFRGQNLSNVSHVTATRINENTINVSWTKTSNITNTYIIYKFDSAPLSKGDGVLIGNTTGTYFNHTTVGYGTHIYYGLFSWNATDDVYSVRFKTVDNYTNPGDPSSLQDTGKTLTTISLTWDKGTNTTRSVVFMNATGNANFPDRTNGEEKINTTGNTGTATGLDANVTYWFSVYSFNPDSGLWSTGNDTDNATTSEEAGTITTFTATQFDDTQINLSWTKANSEDKVLVRYKSALDGTYPTSVTDGTFVYNGSLLSAEATGLDPSMKYYFKAWTWSAGAYGDTPATDIQRTKPEQPVNFAGDIDSGNLIMTWTIPDSASRIHIRNNTGQYPGLKPFATTGYNVTDGNTTEETLTVTGTSSIDYYRAWSYKEVYGEPTYSRPVDLLWGGIEINVYREDKPWIEIGNYSVFVTNEDDESYYNTTVNNPFRVDVSDIPNGEDIFIQISKSGYETRSMTMDLFENTYYTVDFYLPASSSGSPGGDSGEDWYVDEDDDENESYASQYDIYVYGPVGQYGSDYPLENAKITIKRHINTSVPTTGEWKIVFSDYTDANGKTTVYLIPTESYYISIVKENFTTEEDIFVPKDIVFAGDNIITFRLVPSSGEVPDHDIFKDNVVFRAKMHENNTISVRYNDGNTSTINTTIYTWELWNGEQTLIHTDTRTGVQSFTYYIHSINVSRTHRLFLYFENTATFDLNPPVVIDLFPLYDDSSTDFDDRMTDIFGPFEINNINVGWHNLISIAVCIIVLVSVGPFNTGLGIIGCGLSLGLMEIIFSGLNNNISALVTVAPFIIAIGILYIWTKGRPEDQL